MHFDEGASWIHGIQANPIAALAAQAGMGTAFTDDDSLVCYDIGGVRYSDSAYQAAEDALYDEVLPKLSQYGKADQGFEAVFAAHYPQYKNDRLWRFLLSTYITFDLGDLGLVSSLLYDEGEEYGGQEHISTNGYDTLATYLAKGLDIRLQQRVTQVDYSAALVKVSTQAEQFAADYVLVTVPLGVLKNKRIAFTPALPAAKQAAIAGIGMNCVNKFLLTWPQAFWDDVQYICYTPEQRDKFNYFVNVKKFHPGVNALMTFAYAEYGRQTESMSDDQVKAEIMGHLRDIYGSSVPDPAQLLRTRWQTNENTFGAYSYTAVGTEMRHFDDLAEEIEDRLFFAGEHTHIDYFSTVPGAYLSGLREADKIIALQ